MISAIGQGTMGIGGYFAQDATRNVEFVKLLRLGVDLGMTLIDTAEVYGGGHSEELVGEAVRGIRDRVFIATKFSPENSTFEGIVQSAEASLRRLETDWIDLYQTHWPNPRVPIEETMRAMKKLVEDGKVRYIGLSNFSLGEMRKARSCLSDVPLVSTQHEYNLFDRTIEQQVIPFCREQKLTLIGYSPLMQGKIAVNDRRKVVLSEIATKYGVSVAQLILSWLLRDTCVVAVPKASSEKHLMENAAALDCQIGPADYEKISELYAPEIMHVPTDLIEVTEDSNRNVYKTLEEAFENRLNLVPSPLELAEQIATGEILKPIKLRLNTSNREKPRFRLVEGRVRYWAWVIAYKGKVPIPALVERPEHL